MKDVKEASLDLGAGENYMLFASMVTSRSYSDLLRKDIDVSKALMLAKDLKQQQNLTVYALKYNKEIA